VIRVGIVRNVYGYFMTSVTRGKGCVLQNQGYRSQSFDNWTQINT
jgi:hypothetical protein